MRAHLVVGGFLAKVPRLTPARVVALRAAMLGAVVALGLLLAIPAVAMAADINKTVSVDATQEAWQDTGIFLGAGDHVVIDGSGTVDLDKNTPNYDNTPPDGVAETATSNFFLPGAKVGALIGKIDSGDPFLVGDLKTIDSVASSGELYLAVNDSFFGFTDNSGHFTADIAVNHPDTRHPKVLTTAPSGGASGVDPTANIKAKFSEAMKERSINTSTFYLLPGHFTYEQLNCTASATTVCVDLPAPVAATVRYNDDTKTAVLNPTATLASNTEYTAVVEGRGDGDMKAVKDRGGTAMATDYIFYFTTGSGGGDHPVP
jgi:Bacterial Ig-like domain/PA-IL-like protein